MLDGHGGQECAKFAVDEIPMKLATYLRSGMACSEAIHSAFLNTDTEFLKSGRSTAGSTACVLVWDPVAGSACIANTGDTRAVLSRSGLLLFQSSSSSSLLLLLLLLLCCCCFVVVDIAVNEQAVPLT